jgi:hypothetical protein
MAVSVGLAPSACADTPADLYRAADAALYEAKAAGRDRVTVTAPAGMPACSTASVATPARRRSATRAAPSSSGGRGALRGQGGRPRPRLPGLRPPGADASAPRRLLRDAHRHRPGRDARLLDRERRHPGAQALRDPGRSLPKAAGRDRVCRASGRPVPTHLRLVASSA